WLAWSTSARRTPGRPSAARLARQYWSSARPLGAIPPERSGRRRGPRAWAWCGLPDRLSKDRSSSCLRSHVAGRVSFEQILEEGPVVHHRLAQVFGLGAITLIAKRDGVRRAVMLDHARV